MSEQNINNIINNRNPLSLYDITIPVERYPFNEVIAWMNTECSRWCFQQERGEESDYLHWQCRVSLKSKKRVGRMIEWISQTRPGWHVSPTSNPSFLTGNEFYVMKEATRVNGPYSDRNTVNLANIPKRLQADPVWRPWQRTILDITETEADDRTVHVIIDKDGFNGKSFLSMWLGCRNKAIRVPAQRDPRDIMRMIMNCEKSKIYFIDLPRATSTMNQNAIYTAIEEIKNGYCYDDRYKWSHKYFEPPHVFIFTNTPPDTDLLSRQRWRFWTIANNYLVPYDQHQERIRADPIESAVLIPPRITGLNIIRS